MSSLDFSSSSSSALSLSALSSSSSALSISSTSTAGPVSGCAVARIEELVAQAPFQVSLAWARAGVGEPIGGVGQTAVLPAASCIKTAILLELMRLAQLGQIDLEETVCLEPREAVEGAGLTYELTRSHHFSWRELARLMIVVSDNSAANVILARVGMEQCNALLSRIGAKDSQVRRYFMADAKVYGENETTAQDCVRLLQELSSGQTITGLFREEAIAILGRQQFREKIPWMLPPEAVIANKTGELDGVRHDIALVRTPTLTYALAILTAQVARAWEADTLIAQLSYLIYTDIVNSMKMA